MILSKNYKLLFFCHQFYPINSGYANAFLKLIKSIIKHHKNITIDVVTVSSLGDMKELDIERFKVLRIKKSTNMKFVRYFLNPYMIAKKIDKIFKKGNYAFFIIKKHS